MERDSKTGHDQTATDNLALELAEKTDLSPNQAKSLIEKHGHDRQKLFEAAKNFKAES